MGAVGNRIHLTGSAFDYLGEVDGCDVPAAEVGREQNVSDECNVGGVTQGVSIRIVDYDLELSGRRDPTDLAGFVASDVEQAVRSEGDTIWQRIGELGNQLGLTGRPVGLYGDPGDSSAERFDDVERLPVRAECHAVGEVEWLIEPQLADSLGRETKDPGPGISEAVAIGDIDFTAGSGDDVVGELEADVVTSGCEHPGFSRRQIGFEDGTMLQVTGKEAAITKMS